MFENTDPSSGEKILVADIGGTNARFALADASAGASASASADASDRRLSQYRKIPTANCSGIIQALDDYLGQITGARPTRACLAVACPVWGDIVSLTNNNWSFSIKEVRQALKMDHVIVVNDFKALAAGVPLLAGTQKVQIGDGAPLANRPISVIGPGTGLGVATVVQAGGRHGDRHIVFDGEGGHVGFAPGNEREMEILRLLARKFGRVSTERILSGEGLVSLYQALAKIDAANCPALEAATIVDLATTGSCSRCQETVHIFCAVLGSFAGDTAMTLGSQGGVYIGGGIVPRIKELFEASPFRQRFEAKGRTSSFIKHVPTYLITAEHTALNGAAALLLDGYENEDLAAR